MIVDVSGLAWMSKADLKPLQLEAIRHSLTIQPRKVGDHPGEKPGPIYLYGETEDRIGVAREYFLDRRRSHHDVRFLVSDGDKATWPGPLLFRGTLRPEQQASVDAFTQAFKSGQRLGGILRAVPGFGKTVCACALISALEVPTLVIVHKEFLLNQWRERILGDETKGIPAFLPEAQVGLVQQDVCEFEGKHIVIAMVHSLVEGEYKYPRSLWSHFGLVITDECFVGSTELATPAGAVPIVTVHVGMPVACATGVGVVEEVGSRLVDLSDLVLVRFESGDEYICTRDHPFLTLRGWDEAEVLQSGSELLTQEATLYTMRQYGDKTHNSGYLRDLPDARIGEEGSAVLLPDVLWEGQESGSASALSDLPVVPEASGAEGAVAFLFRLLSSELVDGPATPTSMCKLRTDAPVACGSPRGGEGGVGPHDAGEPDGSEGSAGTGVTGVASQGASSARAGRQWSTATHAATDALGGAGAWLEGRVRGADGSETDQRASLSVALQTGPGRQGPDVERRGGWNESQLVAGPGEGREEGRFPSGCRVASVSRVQPSDLARHGCCLEGSRGQIRVYNVKVGPHPSYVLAATGAVVHNCHRIGASTWSRVPPKFSARWRVGLSATPKRKDGADDVFRFHIGPVLYTSHEIRLKPRIRRVRTTFSMVKTPYFNPALSPKVVLLKYLCLHTVRNRQIIHQLVQAVQAGRKVLVLSERLQHLADLEAMFLHRWPMDTGAVPTIGHYVGGRTKEQLESSTDAQVIFATSQYAQEGLDIPPLDTLFLTTPLADVEQAVGRILRPCEGKKDPIVVDFRDPEVALCERIATYRDDLYARRGWT